jgi:hypothetical protein
MWCVSLGPATFCMSRETAFAGISHFDRAEPVPVLLLVSRRSFLGQVLIAAFVVTTIVFAKAKPSLADQQEHCHVPGH